MALGKYRPQMMMCEGYDNNQGTRLIQPECEVTRTLFLERSVLRL